MEILVSDNQGTENAVSGIDIISKDINLSNLSNKINEMRDVLNEICCTSFESEPDLKILTVSQSLDELIVEYMRKTNKQE